MTGPDVVASALAVALILACWLYGTRAGGTTGAIVMTVAVGSHLALCLLSATGTFLPAGSDNLAFHTRAAEAVLGLRDLEPSGPSSLFWVQAVAWVYTPFGPSLWLGYVANQWIYLAAMVQLLHFADEVGVSRHRWKIVLVFSLLPSTLLYCNFLLREVLQVFLIILAVRQLERYRRTGGLGSLFLAAAAFVPFGAIHSGFFLLPPVLIGVAIAARAMGGQRDHAAANSSSFRVVGVIAGTLVLLVAIAAVSSFNDSRRLTQLVEDDVDVTENLARTGERGARTTLPWGAPPGLIGTALFAPVLLGQFLFAPIVPFVVSAPEDLVAVVDTSARIAFLLGVIAAYRKGAATDRQMILFLMATYLLTALIAAVGTATVGTALRHHLKVFWIPITVGAVAVFERSRRAAASTYPTPKRVR